MKKTKKQNRMVVTGAWKLMVGVCGRGSLGGVSFFDFFPQQEAAYRPQEGEDIVKVALEHYTHSLRGEGALHIIVLVIVAVVGLEADCPRAVEQILDVEITDKGVVVK